MLIGELTWIELAIQSKTRFWSAVNFKALFMTRIKIKRRNETQIPTGFGNPVKIKKKKKNNDSRTLLNLRKTKQTKK